MKKIIINENAEKKIVGLLLNESMGYANKVKIIKSFLDANFFKADYDEFNSEECKNLSSPLVIPKNTKNGASEKITNVKTNVKNKLEERKNKKEEDKAKNDTEVENFTE